MIQRWAFVSLLTLSAMAMAGNAPLAATFGQGVASNEQGRRAEFNYEVVKVLVDGQPQNRGRFQFATISQSPAGRAQIRLDRVTEFATQDNLIEFSGQAEFSGPGRLMRWTPNGMQSVNGRVVVRVTDRSNPDPGTPPNPDRPRDSISVRFVIPSASGSAPNVAFEFAGRVDRGNIVVRTATPPSAPAP